MLRYESLRCCIHCVPNLCEVGEQKEMSAIYGAEHLLRLLGASLCTVVG